MGRTTKANLKAKYVSLTTLIRLAAPGSTAADTLEFVRVIVKKIKSKLGRTIGEYEWTDINGKSETVRAEIREVIQSHRELNNYITQEIMSSPGELRDIANRMLHRMFKLSKSTQFWGEISTELQRHSKMISTNDYELLSEGYIDKTHFIETIAYTVLLADLNDLQVECEKKGRKMMNLCKYQKCGKDQFFFPLLEKSEKETCSKSCAINLSQERNRKKTKRVAIAAKKIASDNNAILPFNSNQI